MFPDLLNIEKPVGTRTELELKFHRSSQKVQLMFHAKTELKTRSKQEKKPEETTVKACIRERGRGEENTTRKPAYPDDKAQNARQEHNEKNRGGIVFTGRNQRKNSVGPKKHREYPI